MYEIKPITPYQAAYGCSLPDYAIQTMNILIERHYDGISAVFSIKEFLDELKKLGVIKMVEDFDYSRMTFSQEYQAAGWKVDYNSKQKIICFTRLIPC